MSYATVEQLRQYLPQVKADPKPPEPQPVNELLQLVLDRANAIVNEALGFAFGDWPAETSEHDHECQHRGRWLEVPYHKVGSVAAVAWLSGRGTASETTEAVADWLEEADGRLYLDNGWSPGWYRVEAIWGYGPAPASIVEVELDVAVNIWRGRDATAWSTEVGAEGVGAVSYNRALTWAQRSIIDAVRLQYLGVLHA